MLFDLGLFAESAPIQIAEDNSACIAQAHAGLRAVRNAKHYEVRLRFLQQLVLDGDIEFVYTPTEHQLADFFTKPLDVDTFERFRGILMPALCCATASRVSTRRMLFYGLVVISFVHEISRLFICVRTRLSTLSLDSFVVLS
jgi:hypothetical protein